MGEEFGLVGICALLLIYLLLIGRGLVITAQAQTLFGKLLAGALTMTFCLRFRQHRYGQWPAAGGWGAVAVH